MSVLQEIEIRGQKRNGDILFHFPVASNKEIISNIHVTLYLLSVVIN